MIRFFFLQNVLTVHIRCTCDDLPLSRLLKMHVTLTSMVSTISKIMRTSEIMYYFAHFSWTTRVKKSQFLQRSNCVHVYPMNIHHLRARLSETLFRVWNDIRQFVNVRYTQLEVLLPVGVRSSDRHCISSVAVFLLVIIGWVRSEETTQQMRRSQLEFFRIIFNVTKTRDWKIKRIIFC